MNATQYATSQLGQVFDLLNLCADGIDDAQYNHDPQGTCNSVAKSHVHALTAIDFFVLQMVKGGPMLWPDFATKIGLPVNAREIFGYAEAIPLAPMKEFAAQVQKAALEYVGGLSESDLDREIDTQFFGKQSAAYVLQLMAAHTAGHAGDMASVKGMQGLKGLPF
jgi:hypothetical protein